jgi:hypothetical protein
MGLFVLAYLFEPVAKRFGLNAPNRGWPDVTEALAFVYAIAAPITGWVRLTMLADDSGFIGAAHFESTGLYQTSAGSVGLLALLVFARSLLWKRLDVAALGSALVMVAGLLEMSTSGGERAGVHRAAGRVHPDYRPAVLAGTRPAGWRAYVIPAAEVLGAALIMGPSFVQSLDADAWRYGLILLAERVSASLSWPLVQRRIWLMGAATTFVVMDGAHYLFFLGRPDAAELGDLAIARHRRDGRRHGDPFGPRTGRLAEGCRCGGTANRRNVRERAANCSTVSREPSNIPGFSVIGQT